MEDSSAPIAIKSGTDAKLSRSAVSSAAKNFLGLTIGKDCYPPQPTIEWAKSRINNVHIFCVKCACFNMVPKRCQPSESVK